MRKKITRRTALKYVTVGTVASSVPFRLMGSPSKPEASNVFRDSWSNTHDRVWLGGEYWANPMEDWVVANGAAECISLGGGRSVHILTRQVKEPLDGFRMSVECETVQVVGEDGGAGFRVGVRSEIDEFRSNCFARGGINAGVVGKELVLGSERGALEEASGKWVRLELTARVRSKQVALTLQALEARSGRLIGTLSTESSRDSLLGNLAIVSDFGAPTKQPPKTGIIKKGSRHRFRNWSVSGDGLSVKPEQRFGPILWSMYSLSDSRSSEGFVMKLSALTGPMGARDSREVELQVQRDGAWESLGRARLDPDAWVATFRIPSWNEKVDTPFRLVYRERRRDGSERPDYWTGKVRANPQGRPLRMAALTCQNDYAFPYEPVANNVVRMDPDLVFFSGDQLYEGHGGFGIIRRPADRAILNYLRKYYQFGWAFREAMRNCPTLCLPDDHDVFQGNYWGEAGAKMKTLDADPGASSSGGYAEPARMVNAVHRTNVAHHPDPYDPTPVKQGISAYYGDMVYGGVSFAIISDRQWKSGPEHVDTGGGRPDHVEDPDFDCSTLDKPGLDLLGARQEAFLSQWASDWRGHSLKAVLSQTVFAGVATHHGGPDSFLKADLDSGAWPQTARNRAIDILRPSMALHINGDQHLTTLAQYGVATQRDSLWSFCTPAIAAGYPRWWKPDAMGIPHANRPRHGNADTGEFVDSFGNLVYVYAVGNPLVGKAPNRYDKAHEKGSGFGFITFDTELRTYRVESFRFLIDPLDGQASNQFPGWPLTIHQTENRGENRIG